MYIRVVHMFHAWQAYFILNLFIYNWIFLKLYIIRGSHFTLTLWTSQTIIIIHTNYFLLFPNIGVALLKKKTRNDQTEDLYKLKWETLLCLQNTKIYTERTQTSCLSLSLSLSRSLSSLLRFESESQYQKWKWCIGTRL